MRTLAFFFAILAMALAAPPDGKGKSAKPHPHFNDGGAIPWHTKLADASAQAKKEGKLIFIEYGREL